MESGTESDLVYSPNESPYYPGGLSKKLIYDYYASLRQGIMEFLRGRKAVVFVKSEDLVQLEHEDGGGEKEIEIETDGAYDKWNTGRTVAFYFRVEQTAPLAVISIKPGKEYPPDNLLKLAMEFTENLKEGEGVSKSHLIHDGDRGYYIYLVMANPEDITTLQPKVMEWVKKICAPEDTFSLEAVEDPTKAHVSMDGFEVGGAFPAPYSLNPETGIPCTPISKNEAKQFEPKPLAGEPDDWAVKSNLSPLSKIDLFSGKNFSQNLDGLAMQVPTHGAISSADDKISAALVELLPDLEAAGWDTGVVDLVNTVDVTDLPDGKLGKTEADGKIFLSPKLFEDGMSEVLKDILFHEMMHKLNGPDETKILNLEKERLLAHGLDDTQADERIFERKAGFWGTMKNIVVGFRDWMGHLMKSGEAYTDKEMQEQKDKRDSEEPDKPEVFMWPPRKQKLDQLPETERSTTQYTLTKENPQALPTGTPTDFNAAPANSIEWENFNYNGEENFMDGVLVWDPGDFSGDKLEDVVRMLENKLKTQFPGLRNLTPADIDDCDLEKREAYFYIEDAMKESESALKDERGEKAREEQEKEKEKKAAALKKNPEDQSAFRTTVNYGGVDYVVDVRMIQGKPVCSFPEHHPELTDQEDVSAIYGLAIKNYSKKDVVESKLTEQEKDITRLCVEIENHVNASGVKDFMDYMHIIISDPSVPRQDILTCLGKAINSLNANGTVSLASIKA
jgi:hypothetical protein